MSVEAQSWAYSVALPKQPCAKSVLVALANRADEDGYCWPGIGDLERRTEWNRRTIQRALSSLIEQKLLLVSSRHSENGQQRTNLYRLAIGTIASPISCGEGGVVSPLGAAQRQGEGGVASPLGVAQRQGEGGVAPPKSSSESSVEQSFEEDVAAGTTVPAVGKDAPVVVMTLFDEFWKIYPDRNGKKLEKEATRRLFLKISDEDQPSAIQAARHYAASLSQQGISAKDPKRFLLDGLGQEPWRDWIEPAKPPAQTAPPQARCIWANGGGCEAYAAHPSRYCADHRDKLRAIQAKMNRAPQAEPIVGLDQANAGSGL